MGEHEEMNLFGPIYFDKALFEKLNFKKFHISNITFLCCSNKRENSVSFIMLQALDKGY